jgi:predicted ATPase/DNA-binding SARP family transcriptional activator
VQIRLLGPVEVLGDDGAPVPLASVRQRLLLAGLAARAGEVVSADALIELLWGDALPENPLGALQSQVSRLRRRLGPVTAIATTPSGYRLASADLVDAVRFRALVARARQEGEGELTRLEEALELWRGKPFAGLDCAQLEPVVAALEDDYANAGLRRVRLLLRSARYREAAAAAGELVAARPFREEPVALHIDALAASGRHGEALRVYEGFRASLADGLGLEPSDELRLLHRRVLGGGPGRPGLHLLPALPGSSLVGRKAVIASVVEHLTHARLVTLTGPGGVGKTRVALHVAYLVASSYPDGVWFCDLTTLAAGGAVDAAVASMLGVDPRAGERLVDRLVAFLRPRRALVVLDNCEHILGEVAALVSDLLGYTASTTILATSRARLGVSGEQRFPVEPLAIPTEAEATTLAVQLFCERARAANPLFHLEPVKVEVRELCRVLGGLPLAIEVAASRTAARAPADILAELHAHGGQLRGERQRTARHRSLHAVVAWSCDLLAPPRRDVFERMATFAGGWTSDAAVAAAGDDGDAAEVDAALDELAERSLAAASTTGPETRWTMLEPVRAFAEHQLRRRNRYAETRDRHAAFFLALAESSSSGLTGRNERSWADRLAAELGNLRTAHRWLVDHERSHDVLRLASACYPWAFAGAPAEVSGWAAEAVERFGRSDDCDDPALVGALATAAVGAWRQGHLEVAIDLATQGVQLGGEHAPATRWALDALGDAHIIAGHYDEALKAYRAAIPLAEAAADVVTLTNDLGGFVLASSYQGYPAEANEHADATLRRMASVENPSALGWAHFFAGEARLDSRPSEALPSLRRAVAEAERAGNRFLLGIALSSVVSLEARTDGSAATLRRFAPLITHWQQIGAWSQLWITVRSLIQTLHRAGHPEEAAVLAGALVASPTASPVVGADAARLAQLVDKLIDHFGKSAFEALHAHGASMGDDAALAYTFAVLTRVAAPE